ncbi:MAG: T9SS type A sorting domain-containing protein [Bacteroidetes bacterium]|nr:T9SS type A sorting domain-containing protein [Bacteroidota bacterium]
MQKNILLIFVLTLSCFSLAQNNKVSFKLDYSPIFLTKNGDTINKALIGGLNQPQFQKLDINNDGLKDLVIHDRSGGMILPFINKGGNDISKYIYSPEYVSCFPKMYDTWFLLVDYDKDGKEDLWTKINFKATLFKNITKKSDKRVSFVQISPQLMAYNFNPAPLDSNTVSADNFNIPAIADMDGDGDIDIFSYQVNEGNFLIYRNMTVDFNLPLHPPVFDLADWCWGNFRDTGSSGYMIYPCGYKIYRKHNGGSTLLWFDNDNDGDMDLLLGNAGKTNIQFFKNGKKEYNLTYDSIIGVDGNWPSSNTSVSLQSFPGIFLLDVDNDSINDILIAPNQYDYNYTVKETKQVLFYKNEGTNLYPDFKLKKTNFFTDEFLDHGAYTSPVLQDIDNDNDLDLIIATNGDNAITNNYNDRLILYRNIGNAQKPVFKLEDEDLWGLSYDSIRFLSICFGDLNGDSKIDMLAGNYFGSLYYYKNIGTSTTWAFTTPTKNFENIRVGERSTPQIIDLDKDGLNDIIVGEFNGNFNYYKNTGSSSVPKYTLIDDTLGNFIVNEVTDYDTSHNPKYYWIGNASGIITDINNDGKFEMVCGGNEGKIRVFKFATYNQPKYIEDTTILFDSSYMRYNTLDFGADSKPAIGDIDGDGVKDIIVGNNRGGIHLLKGKVEISNTSKLVKNKMPVIYPNPNHGNILNINKNDNEIYSFKILNISGKTILTENSNPHSDFHQIKIDSLNRGVYFIQSVCTDNTVFYSKIIILK